MVYDDIIVGAGTCGAILGARLSEDRTRRVLLLEAGPDYVNVEATPADLLYGQVSLVDHDWGYSADAGAGRAIPYPRGKVTGGSSAVNGTIALRGDPADFGEWAARGLPEWTWDQVLPFYRKPEHDPDGAAIHSDAHGVGGPFPIHREPRTTWQPFQAAFYDACVAHGFDECDDFNSPPGAGVGVFPRNKRDGMRMSTALTYLAAARGRPRFEIRAGVLIDKVVIDHGRAVAVDVVVDGQRERLVGERIILSAGAVGSPAILLRSGIGPAAQLEALDITVAGDLPVGAVLLDHPSAGLPGLPAEGVQHQNDVVTEIGVRYRSGSSQEDNDMQLCLATLFDPDQMRGFMPDPVALFMVGTILMRPHSVGRLTITTADPMAPPDIQLNYLDDPVDMARMIEGWRIGRDLCRRQEMKAVVGPLLIDDATLADDAKLGAIIRDQVTTTYHPAGTAPMGPASDRRAVVDGGGRVHGIDGLHVVDASIMPTSVRSNTNLTCVMIAERMAASMTA